MRIINEIKLDFKDVLILPKRSILESRNQVNLERTFNFINSKKKWIGIPIIVSNMDTTGTFEMAKALFKHKVITCIHKHYTIDEWKKFLKDLNDNDFNHFSVSTGITDKDTNSDLSEDL
tara:strand:- start:17 stop:373 length:357 start_codon:yes stop_codon:yes gene_type:complete